MRYRLLIDVKSISNERKSDPCCLRLACGIDEKLEIGARIGRAAGMLPCVHMTARPLQHDAKRDLFSSTHVIPPRKCSDARRLSRGSRWRRNRTERLAIFHLKQPKHTLAHP